MEEGLQHKYHQLKSRLEKMGSALLAFSGGVDSTHLLAVGREALGDDLVAATIHSPLHPPSNMEEATRLAADIGVFHVTVTTDELDDENFVANPPERCFICKKARYGHLMELATREGISEVIDGSQADDLADYRPGLEAASGLGVLSPLLECGFVKEDIRSLSRKLGLSTWNLPPTTCLATRIPYYQRVTRDKLNAVDEGERFLAGLGLSQVRVRYLEDRTARIEVAPACMARLISDENRPAVLERMRQLGFAYTSIDLGGYRTGSLNELL